MLKDFSKHKLSHLKLILIGVLFFALLSGCEIIAPVEDVPNDIEDTSQVVLANATPTRGGSINISMRNPSTLNPILNEDVTVQSVLSLVFEYLFVIDDTLMPTPNLIRTASFSDDGMSVELSIKDDIVWSDGELFTPQDIAFTIDLIRANPTSLYHGTISTIASHSIVDNSTIRINFNQNSNGLGYAFLFPVLPRHYYAGQAASALRQMQPLGNGPFVFDTLTLAREMALLRNPLAFRPPYIDNVRVLITPDENTDFYAKEINIIDVLEIEATERGRFSAVILGLYINVVPRHYFDFMLFNFNNPLIGDIRVREAIYMSFLSEHTISTVYQLPIGRATSPINPRSWLYEENKRELPADSFEDAFFAANFEVIDEHGTLGNLVAGVPAPLSFRILVNYENQIRLDLANILRQNLENVGIAVNFKALDFEEYTQELENKNFDIAFAGVILPPKPSLDFLFEVSNYTSQELDNHRARVQDAPNRREFEQALRALQTYMAHNLPIISIAFRDNLLLTGIDIKGEIAPGLGNIFQNVDKWFMRSDSDTIQSDSDADQSDSDADRSDSDATQSDSDAN